FCAAANEKPPPNRAWAMCVGSVASGMSVSPSVAGWPPATALSCDWFALSRWSRPAAPVASGAAHATVHVWAAEPWLPAVSVARTENVCWPAGRFIETGLVHGAGAALSTAQLGMPSDTVNANVTCGPLVALGPCVIMMFGGAVSTLHVRVAGVASVWPA